MASPSKEERILNLILENSPLKHWHFEEIVRTTKMARAAVNKWLRRYQKEGLIKRSKENGKFPYFTCGSNNPVYQSRKKIYMLNKLYQSGLIKQLISLRNAKTVIIFGSIAKGDWYKDSDIDIFAYGSLKGFEKHKYELILHRDIELHVFETKKDIKKVKTGLISNVINGYIVKGGLREFIGVG